MFIEILSENGIGKQLELECNWNECNWMQAGNAIGFFFGTLLEIFIGKSAKAVSKLGP